MSIIFRDVQVEDQIGDGKRPLVIGACQAASQSNRDAYLAVTPPKEILLNLHRDVGERNESFRPALKPAR